MSSLQIISNEKAVEIIKNHSKELWKKLEKAFHDSEKTPDSQKSLTSYEKAARDFAIVRNAVFQIERQENARN